jgi:hypothetical protein
VKFVEFLVRICFATNVKEGDDEEKKRRSHELLLYRVDKSNAS